MDTVIFIRKVHWTFWSYILRVILCLVALYYTNNIKTRTEYEAYRNI